MKNKVQDELKQHFRPEFLNRVDEIIVFPPLSQEQIVHMVDNMIASVELRMRDRDMRIELTQAAKNLLAERGFDPVLGARPLRRTVQREIEDILAEKMLYGEVGPGQIVLVDVEGEGPTATFTFAGQKVGELPDLPPFETAGVEVGDSLGDPVDRRAGSGRRAEVRRRGRLTGSRSQNETVGGGLGDQAVADQRLQAALTLLVVGPDGLEPLAVHRPLGVAEHGHQSATALPIGSGPGLGAPGRPVVRRVAGGPPGAPVARPGNLRSAGSPRCTRARRAP